MKSIGRLCGFLFLAFSFISITSHAQIIWKQKVEKGFIVGLHSAGQGFNYKDPVTKEISKQSYLFFEPYVGYFFNGNFGVGPICGIQRYRSTFDDDYDLFEIGGFVRYYIPIGLNPDWRVSLLFLSEASYRAANFEQVSLTEVVQYSALSKNIITVTPIGAQIKIWKGFFGEISTEWVHSSSSYNRFGYRIGLEYHPGHVQKNY